MRILIVGAGDVGFQLGRRLARSQHDITIIEANPAKVARAVEQLDVHVVEGSGNSYRVLQQAGVQHADVVAAVTDSDDANLMACRLAKKSGVDVTIARVRNPEFAEPGFILSPEDLGADHVIQPEREAANAIIRLLQETSATHVVDFENGRVELIGLVLEPDSPLIGIPLAELGRQHNNPPVQIVAVDRNHETLIPRGEDRLYAGDHLFAICDPSYAAVFFNLAGKRKRLRMSNVMIVGGGMIGRYVAQALAGQARVKLIELNAVRAERLAEALPGVLVFHGDGTDLELLETEELATMDAFVAVTGDDENNIIAALLAKHYGVRRPIVLVNRVAYLPILGTIGIEAAISKQMLTANAVLQFINHQQVAAIASVPGIEGQMIEYIADRGSRITRKPLRTLGFPRGAVVGAILRGGQLRIPDGNSLVEAGDRVIVFAMPKAVDELDKLFAGRSW